MVDVREPRRVKQSARSMRFAEKGLAGYALFTGAAPGILDERYQS